ncbi:anthranilate phosphoribosyltransferase [Sulfurospirillum arcachonense]|uniref:anthranilate phosphoribosyltransferase n=1 Tax=Sulfurospirillum arcachonense TaxID=57666 RepID=UPI000469CE53|nr:anthranilate phosphoribosyltransferase [Sulfurospirillum arcachonense]
MNFKETQEIFESLFQHEMSDEQIRDFLMALPLDETTSVESIAAAASVMRSHAILLPVSDELRPKLLDIVGTGGDKIGSFNISSTVSLLCAAAGCFVAKHGSRSVTSKSGSADMFEKLGVRLDLSIENSAKLLEETGFTFMFARNHHPAMKFIMPVRKSISTKTIFNILGPLTNPAHVSKTMLGVFHKAFVPKIAEALVINNTKSALVVSSEENMDEISISDVTYAARVLHNHIEEFVIDPEVFGIKKAPLESVIGGDAEFNASLVHNIFSNTASDAQRDIVLINTAAALVVDGIARDFQDGLEIARDTINSNKAKEKLKDIIKVSNSL